MTRSIFHFLFVGLAATAAGRVVNTPVEAPLTPTVPPPPELKRAAPTTLPTDSPLLACSGDTTTTDGVQKILDDSGAVAWLDIMFNILDDTGKGEHDWVNKLWLEVFYNDGGSPLTGCGKIGSDCIVETKCSEYPHAMAYWIFRTVGTLHSKVSSLRSDLLWAGWLDSLSIDQIEEDFTLPTPDNSRLRWVSAAFSIAGQALPGQVDGMLGLATDAMDAAADASEEDENNSHVDVNSVLDTLKSMVGAAGDEVARILQMATGNEDPKDLLKLHSDSTYQYATSSFFADNTLLLDENKDNSSFTSVYTPFTENLERKLVDVALHSAWYLLLADDDKSEGDCTNDGWHWLEAQEGKFYCFYWTVLDNSRYCEEGDPSKCDTRGWQGRSRFDYEGFDSKLKKYGFDPKSYMASLIDCELHGHGEIERDNLVNGLPRCFYSNFVWIGSWEVDTTDGWPYLYLHSALSSGE
ncbi:hypothetical protein FQN54_001830 [Arachnomyces sp. PD_36]|nr:hypothetical protein FQN54_001830 [Arachnomyces sp. PD_36]